jgi:hypothetical protein
MAKSLEFLQVPLMLLNCNPNALGELGWYGQWQKYVLDYYNVATARDVAGLGATSLYDNIYLSSVGLCLPGILYNIEKAREIHCRKIVCYGREVPAGIATIRACNELYDLQMCEWVFGPLIDFLPFSMIETLGQLVKNALSSPFGLIYSATEALGCAAFCFSPDPAPLDVLCKVIKGGDMILDIVDSLAGAFMFPPSVTDSNYCKMADEINADELIGARSEEEEAPVEEVAEV